MESNCWKGVHGDVDVRAVVVYLETVDGHLTLKEELHDVFVNI